MQSHPSYHRAVPLKLVGPDHQPPEPRCIVIRGAHELPTALAVANADIPVLLVLRVDEHDRQRVTDMVTGWASGARVSLDWLGANTVVLRTPRAPQLRLISHGMADAAQRALGTDSPSLLTRAEEARLRALAARGSADARRRLIDAYAEFATLVALWMRPVGFSAEWATHYANEELDALVGRRSSTPLVVELVNRIAMRLTKAPADHVNDPDGIGSDE
jgi:hypothetical protein